MSDLKAREYKKFEDIKQTRNDGSEYWSARELAIVIDYTEWRNFCKVIHRAMLACENSGHNVLDEFIEIKKIINAGVAKKTTTDYELSRYACYLIVQNGDPDAPNSRFFAKSQTLSQNPRRYPDRHHPLLDRKKPPASPVLPPVPALN